MSAAAALSVAVPAAAHPAAPAHGKPVGTPAPTPSTAACTAAPVTQPFTAFGDVHQYTLVPGQTADAFTGAGWTLTGGARIVTARRYDGTLGSVLELPAGSRAVSPAMCVTNLDPTARAMVRSLSGSAGVGIAVTYPTRHGHTVSTGNVKGTGGTWALARTVNIHPSPASGWQLAQFTLTPRGNGRAAYEIYNLYVDPRMVH